MRSGVRTADWTLKMHSRMISQPTQRSTERERDKLTLSVPQRLIQHSAELKPLRSNLFKPDFILYEMNDTILSNDYALLKTQCSFYTSHNVVLQREIERMCNKVNTNSIIKYHTHPIFIAQNKYCIHFKK